MERAKEKVSRLASLNLDLVSFWQEVAATLSITVPHYLSPCWYTLDPASLLVTSHYQTELPEIPSEWLAHEYFEDDFHKIVDIVRSPRGISTLHDATNGDPARSKAWNLYIHPYGGEQELLLALRTRAGYCWGVLGLYRAPGDALFSEAEKGFLVELAPMLAEGAWRGLLVGEAADPVGPESPGLIVLNEAWQVESLTPGTDGWLAELPDGDWEQGKLPPAILAIAARALRTAGQGDHRGEVVLARVLSRSGRWIVLHGTPLLGNGKPRAAVIMELAHPARIVPLLMTAYSLTEREQEVTRLVLHGLSTIEIAAQLVLSAHTVQQHLKNIFDKTGVRSRRELVGKLFFTHYEPRLRDNEQRVIGGRPVRGGPWTLS